MDRGAWWAAVHRVAKSWTRLSNFTFTFHFHALEKEMATHSTVLAWRIPGMVGAWWAAVYGVAQSQTRLKRLSSSSSSTGHRLISRTDKNTEIYLEAYGKISESLQTGARDSCRSRTTPGDILDMRGGSILLAIAGTGWY